MTFPASLLPEARSTYRTILRAARYTFSGDLPRRAALENAARATFSSPTLTPPTKGAFAGSSQPNSRPERNNVNVNAAMMSAEEIAAAKGSNSPERIAERERERELARVREKETEKGEERSEHGADIAAAAAAAAAEQVAELEKRLKEWKEVAWFLRRNVVQGQLDQNGAYKLRLTKETELNNNLENSASAAPKTPRPKRDPSRKCGETPPEEPAFW